MLPLDHPWRISLMFARHLDHHPRNKIMENMRK